VREREIAAETAGARGREEECGGGQRAGVFPTVHTQLSPQETSVQLTPTQLQYKMLRKMVREMNYIY
jgi:hypothetical protein